MTVRDRIVEHLKSHAEGVDDDMLTEALGLSRRQHANQECRKLESDGLVERRRVSGKTRNFLRKGGSTSKPAAESVPSVPVRSSNGVRRNACNPWDWEGNVQSSVVAFLTSNRYAIRRG